MTERKLKGGVMLGYFDFIRRQWGEDGVEECARITGIVPANIQAERFYPLAMDQEILKWISQNKGMEFVKKVGNHTVKNLGMLTYLVRYVNIKNLLKKAKGNYEETFNYGEVSILCDDFGKRATIVMKDCNLIEESSIAWLGAFEGMMEVTRTKGTVKLNRKQLSGDDFDEYLLDWS